MSGTHASPALSSYRDEVAWLMQGGESFGDVEDVIDKYPDLNQDQKAALWLFAFSLRSAAEQQLDARAHLASVQ
jgi:hypothetical protein